MQLKVPLIWHLLSHHWFVGDLRYYLQNLIETLIAAPIAIGAARNLHEQKIL
ncbi:hypothetical protein V2H45_18000 [Tumidithrix elongata RA019]|uniref:Uncharacterized protein n=1 Tax=Tumidithrix elongata BACA0141 TaxID=2716417 RepID=A0AAW9Q223_9CYAN|nr:hypothetical protein [Tumidithrix elongata RA019]